MDSRLLGSPMVVLAFTLVFLPFLGCTSWEVVEDPPRTVDYVDLARYAGLWYEVASLPAPFQEECFCTEARYTLREDGEIEVLNSCRKGSTGGPIEVVKARARVVPGSRNAKLELEFFGDSKGDYWIIGLDPEYKWALVGHPSRRYLWVLSRTPRLGSGDLEAVKALASSKGYSLDKLRLTPQGCPTSP